MKVILRHAAVTAVLLVLACAAPAPGQSLAWFATNAGGAAESITTFPVRIDRSDGAGTAAVVVAFGGEASWGVDYEAYAITEGRNPAEGFGQLGERMAARGTNLFAVGAPLWGPGGAVIFFNGAGALLGVITNPQPDFAAVSSAAEKFGGALAFVSSNLLAIGAEGDNWAADDAGAVHLYALAGSGATYLQTLTDPQPSFRDYFGCTVERLSDQRFAVGAFDSDLGTNDAGGVYVYEWNGATALPVLAITNPTPNAGDVFGRSLGVLTTNRVVAGDEFADVGNTNDGVVFIIDWPAGVPFLRAMVTNPTPGRTDQFGHALAVMSSNLFVVAADRDSGSVSNAGAVYVYEMNGLLVNLRATVTNPSPEVLDNFGSAVAALSSNRFVVGAALDDAGATNAGRAYLYEWDGSAAVLLASVTNPAPGFDDRFGNAVEGVGSNEFLVGAALDDVQVRDAGAVYRYVWDGTNAAWRDTLTARAPANQSAMGAAAAALGTNRVLLGAPTHSDLSPAVGAVHIQEWDGWSLNHLATVTNPAGTVSAQFGAAVDRLGNSRFVVGSEADSSEALLGGRAYLYALLGGTPVLLATVTNPTPDDLDYFGSAVSGLGPDRFLVTGEAKNGGATSGGLVYLYEWTGSAATLLATVTNPAPVAGGQFGLALANLSASRFIVGAPGANGSVSAEGAAYLYQVVGATPLLLAPLTNASPDSGDAFGGGVAALSATRFVVGAPGDAHGFAAPGTVYLYEWTGTHVLLLGTATNPSASYAQDFGSYLAGLGDSRFAVGVPSELVGTTYVGRLYVYDWTGQKVVLRAVLDDPGARTATGNSFGTSLSGVDSLGLLVGAPGDSTVGQYAGAAWLYRMSSGGAPLSVTFTPGQTSACFTVFLVDDAWPESTETVSFALSSGSNVTPSGTVASIYSIVDTDPWAYATSRIFRVGLTNAAITWADVSPGVMYNLEMSTNLLDSGWVTNTMFTATGGVHTVIFPAPAETDIGHFRLSW